MRERPGVQVLPDLANELAVLVELEELRGRGRIGRSDGIAAIEDEDVTLGVDGHSGGFAEIEVRRQLQHVDVGVVPDFGDRLLGERRRRDKREQQCSEKAWHGDLLGVHEFLIHTGEL